MRGGSPASTASPVSSPAGRWAPGTATRRRACRSTWRRGPCWRCFFCCFVLLLLLLLLLLLSSSSSSSSSFALRFFQNAACVRVCVDVLFGSSPREQLWLLQQQLKTTTRFQEDEQEPSLEGPRDFNIELNSSQDLQQWTCVCAPTAFCRSPVQQPAGRQAPVPPPPPPPSHTHSAPPADAHAHTHSTHTHSTHSTHTHITILHAHSLTHSLVHCTHTHTQILDPVLHRPAGRGGGASQAAQGHCRESRQRRRRGRRRRRRRRRRSAARARGH